MKKIILLCLLILCACSSNKQIQHSTDKELSIKEKIGLNKISSSNASYFSEALLWDSAWHNAILNFRIYDTSRPDSTGGCPLLAEGEVEVNGGKIKENLNYGFSVNSEKDSLYSSSDTEIKEQEKDKKFVKTKRSICQPYQWWVLGILALLNGALIIFLRYKTKNIQ